MKGTEARALLGRDWPLIPAIDDGESKRAIRPWKHLQTVAASTEYDALDAELWAIPTGAATGVVVLDFDGAVGVDQMTAWGLHADVFTGSGGSHVYVVHPGYPVRNAVRVVPGVDIRGDGGLAYVLGRSLKGEYRLACPGVFPMQTEGLPVAAVALIRERKPPAGKREETPAREYDGDGPGTRAGTLFVRLKCEEIRMAGKGTRNGTLNTVVYTIAGLVAGGEVSSDWAQDAVREAVASWAVGDCEEVLSYAWDAGTAVPWTLGARRIEG